MTREMIMIIHIRMIPIFKIGCNNFVKFLVCIDIGQQTVQYMIRYAGWSGSILMAKVYSLLVLAW